MNKAFVLFGCVSIAGCATGTGSNLPTTFTPNVSSARHFQPLTRGDNPSPSDPTIYLFQGQPDGGLPYAGLVNVKGTLYGTTSAGGSSNLGAVFSVTPGGSETILHSFTGTPDGEYPYASLIYVKGKLYGTTYNGGTNNIGSVFSITTSGKEKVLYSFGSGTGKDGTSPLSDLFYHDGALYGTTYSGGAYGNGTVFKVTLSGMESVVYSFNHATEGYTPKAGVIFYKGAFYGTTYNGGIGSANDGTVFKLTPSGKETVLHTFTGNPDGSEPSADLVEYGGNLYGTTYSGGKYGAPSDGGGTVFKVTRKGKLTVLYSFGGPGSNVDQVRPLAGLLNVGGTFYGTVEGANAAGAVFAITPAGSGSFSFVYQFSRNGPSGSPDGPLGGVIDLNGTLYGTTVNNTGQTGQGTVFAVPL